MSDNRCMCTMAQYLTGDGCRYCQPQEYIDKLHDQIEEDEVAVNHHAELVEALREAEQALRWYRPEDQVAYARRIDELLSKLEREG